MVASLLVLKHISVPRGGVSAATLRERWRNRDAIEDTHGHRKRLDGARRKPLLVHVGGILFDLVIERQSRKKNVSREWIAETAMALFDETGNSAQRCVASDNWVTRFMVRYDLSMRRRTNLTTLMDDFLTDRAVS
ncbi:hypothetical protein PC120_g18760 [Phytophthora cactorum]|nr:hypothetical protein PC120_g18760 [Phytophthora cactorum]